MRSSNPDNDAGRTHNNIPIPRAIKNLILILTFTTMIANPKRVNTTRVFFRNSKPRMTSSFQSHSPKSLSPFSRARRHSPLFGLSPRAFFLRCFLAHRRIGHSFLLLPSFGAEALALAFFPSLRGWCSSFPPLLFLGDDGKRILFLGALLRREAVPGRA